jgi:hypothetical protein
MNYQVSLSSHGWPAGGRSPTSWSKRSSALCTSQQQQKNSITSAQRTSHMQQCSAGPKLCVDRDCCAGGHLHKGRQTGQGLVAETKLIGNIMDLT